MNLEEFESIVELRLADIRERLRVKGKEYAPSSDRLAGFKHAGALIRRSTAQAFLWAMAKHLISIVDIVDNQARSAKPASLDVID